MIVSMRTYRSQIAHSSYSPPTWIQVPGQPVGDVQLLHEGGVTEIIEAEASAENKTMFVSVVSCILLRELLESSLRPVSAGLIRV